MYFIKNIRKTIYLMFYLINLNYFSKYTLILLFLY